MEKFAETPYFNLSGKEFLVETYDIVIVGGGPAGLAAATAARENGIERILILERDHHLGGILNQCIHNGFGVHTFKEELTGPEYADRWVMKIKDLAIPFKLQTSVIDIQKNKRIVAVSKDGIHEFQAKAIILAMGCRERPRGALNIPGDRCAGIYTAGAAQRFVNIEGYLPGREVVILGSGDIGLIMARRMTLEGAHVKMVVELMPYSSGLKRNIVQCLDDFDIPLKLSHTVVDIQGKERLTGVIIARIGPDRNIVTGTQELIACDTLLLSVGLIPENDVAKNIGIALSPITYGPVVDERLQTNIEGIFACGNALHVHDLVDDVTVESYEAGKRAAEYVTGKRTGAGVRRIPIRPFAGIRYTVPNEIAVVDIEEDVTVKFRVGAVFKNCFVSVYFDHNRIMHLKKRILTPGQMEHIKLTKGLFKNHPHCQEITLNVEKE